MRKKEVKKSSEKEKEDKKPKKRINSRTKGHTLERDLVNIFKDLGFAHCKTTRNASRLLDSCKVDLAFIPLNIQAKMGYWQSRIKPEVLFKEMKAHLESNYPPTDPQRSYPKVVINKLDGKEKEHNLVTMQFHEWLEIYKGYLKSLQNEITSKTNS